MAYIEGDNGIGYSDFDYKALLKELAVDEELSNIYKEDLKNENEHDRTDGREVIWDI